MGHLKRVGDKKWRIVYDVTPPDERRRQQKTETLSCVTKTQAQAILAKREEAVVTGTYIQEDITIAVLFERFMQAKAMARRAATTLERYGTLYETYIRPAFGHWRLRNLRQHHLTDAYGAWFQKGKSGRPLSARTLRHIHDLVRGCSTTRSARAY